jgi:hypothetical protein
MTDICEAVIQCIIDNLDNDEFMNQLSGALDNYPPLPTPEFPYKPLSKDRPLPASIRQNEIPVPDCDLDKLWGACVSAVDNISLLVLDFLESLDSADSDATRIAKVVDAIPVVGALADEITVTDVAEFAVLLVDEFKDGFVSGDSLPLRQEIACYLFCLCRGKCSITFDDVFTAFTSVEDIEVDITTTVIALMAKFNLNLFSDQQIYVGLCCLGITALATGNYFFGLFGGDTFNKSIIEEGFDEPSSDWELYCTDCEPVITWKVNTFGGEPTVVEDGDYHIVTCTVPTITSPYYRSQIYIEAFSDGLFTQNVVTAEVDVANSNFGLEEDYCIPPNTNGVYPYNLGSHGWVNDSRFAGNTLVVLRVKVVGGSYAGIIS